MSVTAQSILDVTLILYAQTKRDGTIDTVKTAEYAGKAIPLLNQVIQEIADYEKISEPNELVALTDFVDISDKSAKLVAPYGLGMFFALADGDSNMFGFMSTLYNNAKSKITRKAFQIKDDMNILSGMR